MFDTFSSNPFLLAAFLALCAALVILYLLYFFDRIFIKKRLSTIDFIVLGFNIVLASYSAINAQIAFDQSPIQGLMSAWGRQISVLIVILAQFMLRAKRVKISTVFQFVILLSWLNCIMNTWVAMTVDPRTLVDTEMVGYNPAKGGYVFRFPSEPAMIAVIYYFVTFITKRNMMYLVPWAMFMAYMLFLDKGRIDIVSMGFVMFVAMLRNQNALNFIRTTILLAALGTISYFVMSAYFPGSLAVLKNMLFNFFLALMGFETGEGSVNARLIQFQIVFDHFSKYPGHMIFGTGILNREDMFWRFGELYLKDIGVVGVFFAYGIVGMVALYSLFVYALRLTFKIKVLKSTLSYKLTESIILMLLISSFFNGGFVWSPGLFLIFLLFLTAMATQEKQMRMRGELEMR